MTFVPPKQPKIDTDDLGEPRIRKKDKFGYEIPDKYNRIVVQGTNDEATRDRIIKTVEELHAVLFKNFPEEKSQFSHPNILLSAISIYIADRFQESIIRHEKNLVPQYGKILAMSETTLNELKTITKLMEEQTIQLLEYYIARPNLVFEEEEYTKNLL